jgi:transcriptional regulator of acetoin/glycerol metabolism
MTKEDRYSRLKVYSDHDYRGCLNILRLHRTLILKANIKYFGNRARMARALGISRNSLYERIYQHNLEI